MVATPASVMAIKGWVLPGEMAASQPSGPRWGYQPTAGRHRALMGELGLVGGGSVSVPKQHT